MSLTHNQPKANTCPKAMRLLISVLLLLTVALFTQGAQGAQVTVAWNPSSDSTVKGYKLYWGTQTGQYALLADVGGSTNEVVSNLQAGSTYYFAATSYNAQGVESIYSNEASYAIPSACTYSITPTSSSFTQSGGTGTVNITTQSACPWTASSGASWITITSAASGTGSGSIGYSVSANTGVSTRTASSTIAGQTLMTTQTGGVQTYTLTITKSGSGSGTVTNSPSGTTFNAGTVVTLTATPSSGSTFAGWSGACSGTASTCTATMNGNVSVGAAFNVQATTTYTITATAGYGGSISPSGSVSVTGGSSRSFTMTPYYRYRVAYLVVDGKRVYTSATTYTFSNVNANHTISAYFRRR